MIVVADSSPLNYLILIEQTVLLHRLYGSVLVPDAVAVELRAARAPQPVLEWISKPPPWIEIVEVPDNEVASVASDLDRGERAAIALAERVRADLILIDEADGRIEAARRSFRVTGTLGVLRAAAGEGLIDVRALWSIVTLDSVDELERLIFLESAWTKAERLVVPDGTLNYRLLGKVADNAVKSAYFDSCAAARHRAYRDDLLAGRLRLIGDSRIAVCSPENGEKQTNPEGTNYLLDGVGRCLPLVMLIRSGQLVFESVEAFFAECTGVWS